MSEKILYVGIFILFCLGSILDGLLTTVTLLNLFQEANVIAYAFAVIGSIFVWAFTANHEVFNKPKIPLAFKFLVIIALGVDLLTSFIGTSYYVALSNAINHPIYWDISCCDWSNLPRTLIAFGIAAFTNISTMFVGKSWNMAK